MLCQPFVWSWKGQQADGALPYYEQPVYSYEQGLFSSRWIATHILSAQEFPDVPRLTAVQLEAMQLVNALANEPRFHTEMMFEPGDFQFLNNHVTYHARTGFVDFPEEERRRHLLRMWIAPRNSRALAAGMSAIYTDTSAGAVRRWLPLPHRHRGVRDEGLRVLMPSILERLAARTCAVTLGDLTDDGLTSCVSPWSTPLV